jgi:hypothetical protein
VILCESSYLWGMGDFIVMGWVMGVGGDGDGLVGWVNLTKLHVEARIL